MSKMLSSLVQLAVLVAFPALFMYGSVALFFCSVLLSSCVLFVLCSPRQQQHNMPGSACVLNV